MNAMRIYAWESLPHYQATQHLSRRAGAIMASMPRKHRRRAIKPLVKSLTFLAMSITMSNAEIGENDEPLSLETREEFRRMSVMVTGKLRELFECFAQQGVGERSDVTAALEMIERIEEGLAENEAELKRLYT